MSDRSRRRFACLLMTAALILCLSPALLLRERVQEESFQAGQMAAMADIGPIPVFDQGIVRVNDADAEELQILPGVGETTAAMILAERENNGAFFYPEDLTAVRGIGKQKIRQMLPWLDLRLNTDGE